MKKLTQLKRCKFISLNCTESKEAEELWKVIDESVFKIRPSLEEKHKEQVVIRSKPGGTKGGNCVIKWPSCW